MGKGAEEIVQRVGSTISGEVDCDGIGGCMVEVTLMFRLRFGKVKRRDESWEERLRRKAPRKVLDSLL